MKKIIKVLKNPFLLLAFVVTKISPFIKNDKLYLKILYFCYTNKKLNLNTPITFGEKIQWLKLNSKSKIATQMVDKYEVRRIIEEKIGKEYLIPLLGVWDNFEDIDFNELPNQFVLKTTHDSGTIFICKDKSKINVNKVRKIFNRSLKHNYFLVGREYPYKNVKPRIIAEKLMIQHSGEELKDYKFFCFSGVPKFLFYVPERFSKEVPIFNYYDMELNKLPFTSQGHPETDLKLEIKKYREMVDIVKKICKGFAHIRVDLYNINGKIYFGEFTFFHDGGLIPFTPKEWNKKIGDMIKLPTKD